MSKSNYGRTYRALRVYGSLFLIAGVIMAILGGLSIILGEWINGIAMVLISIPFLAFTNFIELMINIEDNTERTANYLKELVHGKEKSPKISKTGYLCTNCSSEVGYDDVKCKNCKVLLGADGATKKVKKR